MNTDSFESFFQLLNTVGSKSQYSTKISKYNTKPYDQSPRENISIFDKLHYESVELKSRHLRREFQSKKKREYEQRLSCTFRPSSNIITVVDEPEAFYHKNIDWLQRKNKEMRRLQCQKAEDKLKGLTLTPRINKKIKEDKENKVYRNQGVNEFLQRYKKARQERKYKEQKMTIPNGHCWNVKRGASELK